MKLETNEYTEATVIIVSNRTTAQNYAKIAQSQIEELQKFKKNNLTHYYTIKLLQNTNYSHFLKKIIHF